MTRILCLAIALLTTHLLMGQPPEVAATAGSVFGQAVTAEQAIGVEQLVAKVQKDPSGPVSVKFRGVVSEVCAKEGCWIKVGSGNGSFMVKMKDHAFAVPLVLNGKSVVIDGVAEEKVTSIAQLKHFAEDAGKTKADIEKITAPKKEIVVVARGILVL